MRENIINAILDCRSDGVDYPMLETLAKMDITELIKELVADLYSLREELDNLFVKSNEDSQKLLDIIENIRNEKRN